MLTFTSIWSAANQAKSSLQIWFATLMASLATWWRCWNVNSIAWTGTRWRQSVCWWFQCCNKIEATPSWDVSFIEARFVHFSQFVFIQIKLKLCTNLDLMMKSLSLPSPTASLVWTTHLFSTELVEFWDAGSSDERISKDIQETFHKRHSRPVIEVDRNGSIVQISYNNQVRSSQLGQGLFYWARLSEHFELTKLV